jgi:hypothetical protein
MQRKQIRIVLGLSLVSLLIQCEKPAAPVGLTEGRVLLLTGTVTRNGEALAVDAAVKQGDRIETAESSSVEIAFAKGLIMRLGANTKAILDLQASQVQLNKGWFAAVKNANEQKLEVVTPTAVAAVRGTSLCMKVESETSTYACTCNGTVHFHADGIAEEAVTAAEHSAMRFVKEGESIKKQEAGLEFHDNKGIETLAKKIDHPLDWTKPSK